MRWWVALILFLTPALARAQTAPSSSEKTWTEVQQYAAEATGSQECAVACKALESLARATQQLCEIGPEHCDEARAKLRDVVARVRAACPDCQSAQNHNAQPGTTAVSAQAESAPAKGGGCAGCATPGHASDGFAWAIAALGLLATRRKK